jgi:2-polyprenyl-3-methyl-5-hydroxy-6-metoxy-1,4-benzoquinol methylase
MTDFGTFSSQSPGSPDVYEAYIRDDPYRRGAHFPAVMAEIGDSNNKRILDMGTGDGQLPRLLASHGATVVGYDHNPRMIRQALAHDDNRRLDVAFIEATPQGFRDDRPFDAATAVMVLNYAPDLDGLTAFFRCAQRHLVPGGTFVSVVLNPQFTAFDADFIVRRLTRRDADKVHMEFLEEATGKVIQQAVTRQYSRDDFERAAVQGGMRPDGWKRLQAASEAVIAKGESFWRPFHQHQPYAVFVVRNRPS